MAFEWLVTEDNAIVVREPIKNRDEDIVCELTIGRGYGIFRGQNQVEYVGQSSAQFSHVGTLVFYEIENEVIEMDGKTYTASHTYPKVGDICEWRGVRYDITGVDPHPDVHGDQIGYTLRCASGTGR